jgi:tetratricopeptide (TPR) repeat protein
MNEYDEIQVSEWLRDGIAAAKIGRRDEARELLLRVIEANERSEQAWLWLSGVVDGDQDRLICLENVLALNPDNVQARAGLKWLEQKGVKGETHASEAEQGEGDAAIEMIDVGVPRPSTRREPQSFMTPEGCVYCGLPVGESDVRCPFCRGLLTTKRFKHEERSPTGYLLHAYWLILAGVNLIEFFLIGVIWENVANLSDFIKSYLPYLVGPVVIGNTVIDTFIEPNLLVQIVRFTLAGLGGLGVLVALGLFLRRPLAHALGLVLIALYLIVGIALFALGFLGYFLAAVRGVFTLLLTTFMFQTVEDFSKQECREYLEPDRHLLNDVDYYARGRYYEKRGMWAKALLHWQRATVMNPQRDTYFASVARAYAHLGHYEQALSQVEEALRVSRTPEEWQPLRDVILAAQRSAATGASQGGQNLAGLEDER